MNTARFAFPLNVYARMLELGEGRVDYLHYGLFEHPDEPVWQAQERASRLLWSVLPPPCRVLEVGIGVGTTLRRLADAGYTATGITPDAAQIAEVQARHGDGVRVLASRLEELDAAQGPWDLMLLQESAQYIDPLALFEAADRLLVADDATLVVMDEFALQRLGPQHDGLHDHAHFLALAARMGWRCTFDRDVSLQARGTLAAIGRLVQSHRQPLQHELALPAERLDELIAAAQRYAARYEQGHYGYRLMRLQRNSRPSLRLGAVTAAHAPAMRALFQQVFGKTMDAAEWQWKYGDGRGRAVGLWRGEELVAHYGATTRPVRIDGEVHAACQVGDVMVRPDANAGLGRQGALYRISATLLEAQIGWGKPHRVGFGFPNRRAMQVAERLGLYAAVDEVVQLEWPAVAPRRWRDAAWRLDTVGLSSLRPGSAAWRELQRLWEAMAAALAGSLLPVRDPAWLHHRYALRPGADYRLALLRHRLGGPAAGALVLRDHPGCSELVDLIGPPAGHRRLVRAARRAAAAAGKGRLQSWITRSHAHWLDDADDPAERVAIDVIVPSCAHTAGPPPDELRGRWFLMPGDTDFR